MKTPPSKVIAYCGSKYGDAAACVEWAVNQMCAGQESPSLIVLAGFCEPLPSDEVRDYTIRSFHDLGMKIPTVPEAIMAYVSDLIQEISNDPEVMQCNLALLCDLCIELDYEENVYPFYLLRWAFDDLQVSDVQWYWDGARRDNIVDIVLEQCKFWLRQYNNKTEKI